MTAAIDLTEGPVQAGPAEVVALEGVSKSYPGGVTAVRDVSLSISSPNAL